MIDRKLVNQCMQQTDGRMLNMQKRNQIKHAEN